jgi:hypothetical protein
MGMGVCVEGIKNMKEDRKGKEQNNETKFFRGTNKEKKRRKKRKKEKKGEKRKKRKGPRENKTAPEGWRRCRSLETWVSPL